MATMKKVIELLDSIGAKMIINEFKENKYPMHLFDASYKIKQDVYEEKTSNKYYHVKVNEKHMIYFVTLSQIEKWALEERTNMTKKSEENITGGKPAKPPKKLTQKQIERREIKAAEATNKAIMNGEINYPVPALWTPDSQSDKNYWF